MPINSEHIHIFVCGVWFGWLVLALGLVVAESRRPKSDQ